MKKLICIFLSLVILMTTSVTSFAEKVKKPDLRVLFIGNSFTFVNDLPDMVKKLAASGGYNIIVDRVSHSGYSLKQFANPKNKYGKIVREKIENSKWDYVVLQEQSQIPAYDDLREGMYKSARTLDYIIKRNGSKTIFFMTWGYKNGDALNSNTEACQTFEGMQEQLEIGYTQVANELNDKISPVGIAWLNTETKDKTIDLWKSDNKHPSTLGTYLSACVFYSTLLKKSPSGLKYTAGINRTQANLLQDTAYSTYREFEKER